MKLSKDFTLEEFIESNKADELGIDNIPSQEVIDRLKILCQEKLQPIRDAIGRLLGHDDYYISITSGYRCQELNEAIGGSDTSFHRYGYAGDCELYIKGKENNNLLFHVAKLFEPTELIWEYGMNLCDKPHHNYPDWVHIAYNKEDTRKMVKVIL